MKSRTAVAISLLVIAAGFLVCGLWLETTMMPQVTTYDEHERRLKADYFARSAKNNSPEVLEQGWKEMVASGAVKTHYESFQRLRHTRVMVWSICAASLAAGLFLRSRRSVTGSGGK